MDEGPQYRLGKVTVQSVLNNVDTAALRGSVHTQTGDVYDADAVSKTVEDLTMALSKSGEPFANVVAGSDRRPGRLIDLVYTIGQGQRLYVERIDIHGNSKTHDDVIRREFDFGEGDAYNRALVERGERHLKALGYFKSVKVTTEPGSAPDRVVLEVNVEERQTGNFFISGGYSTTDGMLAQVSISDNNVFGTGDTAKASVTYGQYAQGFDLAFADPWFMGQRLGVGADLFGRETFANSNQAFNTSLYGARFSVTTPLNENLSTSWNYSIYNQGVSLNSAYGPVSLPIQQAARRGPIGYRRSATARPTRRSTIRKTRKPASASRPTMNSPGSGARRISQRPPKTCGSIIRSPATSSACCAPRAAT